MRIQLLESKYSPNSIFIDSATGDRYVFDPSSKKFVKLPSEDPGDSNKPKKSGRKSGNDQGDSDNGNDSDNGSDGNNPSDGPGDSNGSDGDGDGPGDSGDPGDGDSTGDGPDDKPFKRNKKGSENQPPKRTPRIGDRPDDEETKKILDQEAQERAENDEDAGRSEEENLERIARVQKLLDDEEEAAEIKKETETQVQKSRQQKRDIQRKKQLKQFQNSDNIEGFIISLNNFIKNEIKARRVQTYSKLNKTYNSNVGPIIRRGTRNQKNPDIPRINVYFDQSGSWGADDIKVGESAIATLNQYVKKKELVIDVYKFANRVGELDEYVGGGTYGEPIMKHIRETRPDNVIVMTDSDITDITSPVTVPGGVWILWKRGLVSDNLKANLHGRKLTKYFNIKGID